MRLHEKQALSSGKILFVLLLLSEVGFFSLPYTGIISSICSYNMKVLGLGVMVLMFFGIARNGALIVPRNRFSSIFKYWLLVILLIFAFSIMHYSNASALKIIWQYHQYFTFFLIFDFMHYLRKDDDFVEYVIKTVIVVCTIYAMYSIVTKICYEYLSVSIMDVSNQLFSNREGTLRLG